MALGGGVDWVISWAAQSVVVLHSALRKGTFCAFVQPLQLLAALLRPTKPFSRRSLLKPGRFTALIATILLLLLVRRASTDGKAPPCVTALGGLWMFPVVLLLHCPRHPGYHRPCHAAFVQPPMQLASLMLCPAFHDFASASLFHSECRRCLLAGCGTTVSTHAVLTDACMPCCTDGQQLRGYTRPYICAITVQMVMSWVFVQENQRNQLLGLWFGSRAAHREPDSWALAHRVTPSIHPSIHLPIPLPCTHFIHIALLHILRRHLVLSLVVDPLLL